MAVAADLADDPGFVDGVQFVELSSITDAGLVPATIAGVIGAGDLGGGHDAVLAALADVVRNLDVLLVLDNFEHVLEAATTVAALLAAAPKLSVLATSRRALRVRGEHQLPVPPLALADAVTLFAARARAVNPMFTLDDSSTNDVESICDRLDGLPLAIELAAARSNVLSPAALRARLGRKLSLLAGGPRDQPERLRSVQAMVAWSVDGLEPDEQRCLAELSVFSSGWSVDAAESVCSDEIEVIDALGALCDHHLVVRNDVDGEPRFSMFETVREVGATELGDGQHGEETRLRHAEFFLALSHDAEPPLVDADQAAWIDRIELEHGNIRAALAWAIEHDPELALDLAGRMSRPWLLRGYASEGLEWLDRSLAAAPSTPSHARALALLGAGSMLEAFGDDRAAEARYTAALDMCSELGDQRGEAVACRHIGNAILGSGRYDEAASWYQRSLEIGAQLDVEFLAAAAVFGLGNVAYFQGDLATAERRWSESAEHFRATGDTTHLTAILNNLAELAALRGDHATSLRLHEETIELRRALGDRIGLAQTMVNYGHSLAATGDLAAARLVLEQACDELRRLGIDRDVGAGLYNLAEVARAEGRINEALSLAAESLEIKSSHGEQFDVAAGLALVAVLAADLGQGEMAARLLGAAVGLRTTIGARPVDDELDGADIIATVRRAAGDGVFDGACAEGERWTIEEALGAARYVRLSSEATSVGHFDVESRRPPVAERLRLTARELEVLGYLAQRFTDREIAAELVISLRTVTTHVGRILTKLGVDGRRQAAAEAERLGLVAS